MELAEDNSCLRDLINEKNRQIANADKSYKTLFNQLQVKHKNI